MVSWTIVKKVTSTIAPVSCPECGMPFVVTHDNVDTIDSVTQKEAKSTNPDSLWDLLDTGTTGIYETTCQGCGNRLLLSWS